VSNIGATDPNVVAGVHDIP